MTAYDRMVLDLLLSLRKYDERHIIVGQLANEYGLEPRHVEEKLAELHTDKIIRLSAYHESGKIKPLEEWPSPQYFFAYSSDGNHKRVRLLQKGDELLRKLAASQEPQPAKQAIGFHV